MKREVLFETAKRIVEADNALIALQAPLQMEDPGVDKWVEAKYTATVGWKSVSNRLDEVRMPIRIVCSKDAAEACDKLGIPMNGLAVRLANGRKETYAENQQELSVQLVVARAMIRQELGVEDIFR